jgi:hypothetical protein
MTDEVRTTYNGAAANADLTILAGVSSAAATAMPGGTTTNPLYTSGSRPFVVKGVIANAAATYTGTVTVGAINTIATGLPGGTIVQSGVLRIKATTADYTTQGATLAHFFDANPTASTYTNNVAPLVDPADITKFISTVATTASNQGGVIAGSAAALPRITTDANGNIYFALVSSASNVFANVNKLYFEVDGVA